MHGGFTLSGGEPLMQDRFAARLFAAAKGMGVHTAIETNGYYGDRLSDDELRNIDLVILDMKAFTPEQHRRVTGGMGNEEVLEFCRRLAALSRPMWLRYVLVPGLTDDLDEIEQRRPLRGVARRGRTGRDPAVSPDGALQMGAARTGL